MTSWLIIGGILLISGILVIYLYLKPRKLLFWKKDPSASEAKFSQLKKNKLHLSSKIEPNSIILFGGFQVIDAEGKEITASFTPLLKKLMLFIMLNSLKQNTGVSSNILYETFWFDKSMESARNNRAVNIVKLKSLLENVGKASISKDTGYWKFEMQPDSLYIDYLDYLNIMENKDNLTRDDIERLLKIISKGAFLRNTDAEWLDVYKSEVSNEIIDTLAKFIESSDCEPDFVLQLTNCMFTFDIASEEAMILQCHTLLKLGNHSLAKKTYAKFIQEYKLLYDEDYDKSFNKIMKGKINELLDNS